VSGGSFDYAYIRVEGFSENLLLRLDSSDKVDEYGDTPNKFKSETLSKLYEIERMVRVTSALMKEVEWLYSGDTSDDSFMKRVAGIEAHLDWCINIDE
jgi:3-methyladenine DNA glycosylase Tag